VTRNDERPSPEIDDLARAWAEADAADASDASDAADASDASDASNTDEGVPGPERIWNAAAGTASAEEIRELALQAATDPRVAIAWRLARELGAGSEELDPALAPQAQIDRSPPAGLARGGIRRGIWRPWPVAAALAAALLVVVGLRFLAPVGPSPEPGWREGETSELLVPEGGDGAVRPRADFALRWRGVVEPSTRYTLRITTGDLRLVYEAFDLESPEATVPEEALAPWPAGTTLYWQVEARMPDGRRVSSPSVRVVLAD
jgi:hypothetical protein